MIDFILEIIKIYKNIFKGIKFIFIAIAKCTGAITGLFKKKQPSKE